MHRSRPFAHLCTILDRSGIDSVTPFRLETYNEQVRHIQGPNPDHPAGSLCKTGGRIGLLVSCSKRVWPHFIAHLAEAAPLEEERAREWLDSIAHPLRGYVDAVVERSLADCGLVPVSRGAAAPHPSDGHAALATVYYADELGPGRLVAFQRLADAIGLAPLDPQSHLNIHPVFGQWFMMKAMIVLSSCAEHFLLGPTPEGVLPPPAPRPPPAPVVDGVSADDRVRAAMALAIDTSNLEGGMPTFADVKGRWRMWVGVRDAVWPDHKWRYSDTQIEYHYTSGRQSLLAAIKLHRGLSESVYGSLYSLPHPYSID